MGFINFLTLIFLLIGALNWGSIGIAKYNFIYELLKGYGTTGALVERISYIVTGVFGVIGLSFLGKLRAICSRSKKESK